MNFDKMQNDGTISAAHLSPINLLGKRLEGNFDAATAMREGRLADWNVRMWDAKAVDPNTGRIIAKPGMSEVVRDNPETGEIEVLSRNSVSKGFTIVQNEAHAAFLDALVEESGAHFEMAGSVDGGRKVFLSMKLPGHIKIGGLDIIENSLLALNSHDGSTSFTLGTLPVRYACSNVLNCLFAGTSNLIRVRHTSGMMTNLQARAREALDISFAYLDNVNRIGNRLVDEKLTQARFEEIVEREFGPGEDASAAAVTRAEKKIAEISHLFADAQTQDRIRETAWAGFNALTEWNDHFAPTRGSDREVSRAAKAVLDPAFKNRALRLMLAANDNTALDRVLARV